jgi:hypothetical protein
MFRFSDEQLIVLQYIEPYQVGANLMTTAQGSIVGLPLYNISLMIMSSESTKEAALKKNVLNLQKLKNMSKLDEVAVLKTDQIVS